MTNISKAHQEFSEFLNNPRVLEYPEEFLGPNYEAVLDFWLFLDGLTEDQLKTIDGRFLDFYNNQRSEWFKARDEAFKASEETIGEKFADEAGLTAYWAVKAAYWAVKAAYYASYWATRELIGMHLILKQQKPLKVFNMFLEP